MVGAVLLVGVVVFAAVALKRNWDAVREDLGLIDPASYVASGTAAVAGLLLLWASWATTLAGLGAGHLRRHDSLTIYFSAQLGKYVPGSLWPAVIQARLGRRNGVDPTTMVLSYAIWMAALCSVGVVTGALVLSNPDVGLSWVVVVGCVAAGLLALPLALHDRGLPALAGWALHRTGRSTAPVRVEAAAARRSTVLCLLTWIVFGVHAWFLAAPLGASLADLPLTVGAFSLAFVAGIVVVPLPAGAGVRETVLVLTLGASIGRPGAITVALVSRLIMIVAELLLAIATGVPGAIRWSRAATEDVPA